MTGWLGDGAEERADAAELALRLQRNPTISKRRRAYYAAVAKARRHALTLSQDDLVSALKDDCPAYIEELLRSEDERFGHGSLAERYARTFYKDFSE